MSTITVITGSPRRGGNTSAMTDSFVEAAEGCGHTVRRFDAGLMDLKGCRACMGCYSNGRACVIDDEFNDIADSILGSDVVVFAAPLYWYTWPAQIKCVIDRVYALCVGKKDVSGKRYAVIACCEEEDATVLEGITVPMEKSAALLGWTRAGEVLVPGVFGIGDIEGTDGCERAAELARGLRDRCD